MNNFQKVLFIFVRELFHMLVEKTKNQLCQEFPVNFRRQEVFQLPYITAYSRRVCREIVEQWTGDELVKHFVLLRITSNVRSQIVFTDMQFDAQIIHAVCSPLRMERILRSEDAVEQVYLQLCKETMEIADQDMDALD